MKTKGTPFLREEVEVHLAKLKLGDVAAKNI